MIEPVDNKPEMEQPVEPTEPAILAERKHFAARKAAVYVIWAIGIILTLYGLTYIFVGSPTELKNALKANKELDKKIDSIKQHNAHIDSELKSLGMNQVMFVNMIETNNKLMQKNNDDLKKFRNVFNQKITSVDNYTVSDLDSFFKQRYKKFYKNQK